MKTYIIIMCQLIIITICQAQKSKKLFKYSITIGTQNVSSTSKPLVDLKEGKTFAIEEIVDNQNEIDIIYAFENQLGPSLLVPFSPDLKYFGDSYKIEIGDNWDVKNRGNFIVVKYNKEARKIFRSLRNSDDFEEMYLHKLSEVKSNPEYNSYEFETARRVSGLSQGDLILFYSQDRAFYSAGLVTHLQLGDAGSIIMEFKVAP